MLDILLTTDDPVQYVKFEKDEKVTWPKNL